MSTSAKRYAKGVWRSSNDKAKKAKVSADKVRQDAQSAVSINQQISDYDVTADMDRSDWAEISASIDSLASNLTGVKSGLRESLKAKMMDPFNNKDTMNVVIDNLKDVYKLDKPELDKVFAIDEKNLDKRMGIYGSVVSTLRASAKEMTPSQFAIEAKRVTDEATKTVKSDDAVNKAFDNLTKKPVLAKPALNAGDLTGAPVTKSIKFKGQPPNTRLIRLKDGTTAWWNVNTGETTPIKESK
jgi:hypothetical protein